MIKPYKRILKYDYKKDGRNSTNNYTERSQDEYHSSRWTRESRQFRIEHPTCKRCEEQKGLIVASECVDHVIPPKISGDFWNKDYWQALCTPCNREKGIEDKKLYEEHRKRNKGIGR